MRKRDLLQKISEQAIDIDVLGSKLEELKETISQIDDNRGSGARRTDDAFTRMGVQQRDIDGLKFRLKEAEDMVQRIRGDQSDTTSVKSRIGTLESWRNSFESVRLREIENKAARLESEIGLLKATDKESPAKSLLVKLSNSVLGFEKDLKAVDQARIESCDLLSKAIDQTRADLTPLIAEALSQECLQNLSERIEQTSGMLARLQTVEDDWKAVKDTFNSIVGFKEERFEALAQRIESLEVWKPEAARGLEWLDKAIDTDRERIETDRERIEECFRTQGINMVRLDKALQGFTPVGYADSMADVIKRLGALENQAEKTPPETRKALVHFKQPDVPMQSIEVYARIHYDEGGQARLLTTTFPSQWILMTHVTTWIDRP